MPSISELMNAAANRGVDGDAFDIDAFMKEIGREGATQTPPPAGDTGTATPPAESTPTPDTSGTPTGTQPPVTPPAAPAPAAPGSVDQDQLSPTEARELLELYRGLRQQAEQLPPPPPPAEPPPPAAQLPDFIDPEDKFQAAVWQKLEGISQAETQRENAARQQIRQQAMVEAANRACSSFAQKYKDTLTEDDVENLAKVAGANPLAQAIRQGDPSHAIDAYTALMESTLWATPAFRDKAVGVTARESAEAEARKAKLTALSSAASPAAPTTPTQAPLAARPDGRLEPKSRERLVREFADQLRAAAGTGGF
jgi:hypothetical protein